jgi:hypothetical protein
MDTKPPTLSRGSKTRDVLAVVYVLLIGGGVSLAFIAGARSFADAAVVTLPGMSWVVVIAVYLVIKYRMPAPSPISSSAGPVLVASAWLTGFGGVLALMSGSAPIAVASSAVAACVGAVLLRDVRGAARSAASNDVAVYFTIRLKPVSKMTSFERVALVRAFGALWVMAAINLTVFSVIGTGPR